MNLKYTFGKAGTIVFDGEEKTVWKYRNIYAFLNEVKELGRVLGDGDMAWVLDENLLILGDKVVASTTSSGKVTWLKEPYVVEGLPRRREMVGQRAKCAVVDDYAGEVQELWAGVLDFDWESIMIKSSI